MQHGARCVRHAACCMLHVAAQGCCICGWARTTVHSTSSVRAHICAGTGPHLRHSLVRAGNSLTHDPKNPKTILAAGSIIQDHSDMDVALIKCARRAGAVARGRTAQVANVPRHRHGCAAAFHAAVPFARGARESPRSVIYIGRVQRERNAGRSLLEAHAR